MNRTLTGLSTLVCCTFGASLLAQPKREPLMHVKTTFEIVVKAPLAAAMPLFGPEGERAWAGRHWDPKFVYPQPGRDVQGAVFTLSQGPHEAVWVNTQFDLEARYFQYVYVIHDLLTTTIDVHFCPIGDDATRVTVEYSRVALTPAGNAFVSALHEQDERAGKEWQNAIDAHLASQHD